MNQKQLLKLLKENRKTLADKCNSLDIKPATITKILNGTNVWYCSDCKTYNLSKLYEDQLNRNKIVYGCEKCSSTFKVDHSNQREIDLFQSQQKHLNKYTKLKLKSCKYFGVKKEMTTNDEININGTMIKDILEKHFKRKLKITAVELNDDMEVLHNQDNLILTLEGVE